MVLQKAFISLIVIGLMGCATSNELGYAQQAAEREKLTLEQLIAKASIENLSSTSTINEQIPTTLTDLINIPELNEYLQQAMVNNPNLQQSIIALKIAYEQKNIALGNQLPSISTMFSGETKEDSDDVFTSDLSVSWEVDLWQKLANTKAAAKKDIASTEANLQATKNLLAANIMRSWLEISLNKQLLSIEQHRLAILENTETLILQRYQNGLGRLEDIDNAKTSLAATRSTVAQYKENLARSERALTLLTGQWAANAKKPNVAAQFPRVINSLNSLSQQNMAGRPDLQQAFLNIEAESFRTKAAYKAMLPSFSLAASLSDMALTPSEALFVNPLWHLLGQISAPLFQGGKLKSQAEVAELTLEKSYWVYQETLLNAVNEVENAVGNEFALAQQQEHLKEALASSKRSDVTYEQKYREGLVDVFDLLSIQQQTYDTKAKLVNATYQRLVNRIDLGLALGLGVSK